MQVEQELSTPDSQQAEDIQLINRDLSDLAFVGRVLEEAENEANPVLERVRFLAITGTLLDEFYRIRVAFLREQIRMRGKQRGRDGIKPSRQLKSADKYSNRLIRRQDRCWRALQRDLRAAEIVLIAANRIAGRDLDWLATQFREQIRPWLTPISVLSDAGLSCVRDGDLLLYVELAAPTPSLKAMEAVVPIPQDLPRFLRLPGSGYRFIAIEEVIKVFFGDLFTEGTVRAGGLARVLREGSLKRSEDGDDLLQLVREAIERREHADVIRLRVERTMPDRLLRTLASRLGLLRPEEIKPLEKSRRRATASEFVVADAFLALADLMQLIDLLPDHVKDALSFSKLIPVRPGFVAQFDGDLFRAIAAKDRLLHFPYEDFDVLVMLIRQAAVDDSVLSIKQTLYRTGTDSPIVAALALAARRGKSVEVVVEVQAREDEERNIGFAALLEEAGAEVSYGLLERKVHAKLLIIERLEDGARRRYVQCSTGNYSVSSGQSYTDLCLFSANDRLADDTEQLFTYAHTGVAPPALSVISLSPFDLRKRIESLIERETRNATEGKPAAIWMKLNRLSDENAIRLLYRASQAGVDIHIIVRGICCLRPGIQGLSERIHVKSVVGRFLEHSRLFCFANGSELPSDSADVFISSADLMSHKLDVRVEMLVPIADGEIKRRIQRDLFVPYLEDQANSWRLGAEDKWIRESAGGNCVHAELAARTLNVGDKVDHAS
jgi:polyphosphate kinase